MWDAPEALIIGLIYKYGCEYGRAKKKQKGDPGLRCDAPEALISGQVYGASLAMMACGMRQRRCSSDSYAKDVSAVGYLATICYGILDHFIYSWLASHYGVTRQRR